MDRLGGHPLKEITDFCEPVYRFCVHRLGYTAAAEDLAQEILAEVVEGLGRRTVRNVDAWVWAIARNRFRRLFMARAGDGTHAIPNIGDELPSPEPGAEQRLMLEEDKQQAFQSLIGMADKYRRVLVAFYIHGETYEQIAARLGLPMSSVKWRIHEGRKRLRERWDNLMDEPKRVYDRIEWWVACNGSMDPNRYLDRQIARAIALAAYEKPVTVEEISQATGIPAVFIEDEMATLLYGEALVQKGTKYATNFILLKLEDHREMIQRFRPLAADLASRVLAEIQQREDVIRGIVFYGSDLPLEHLLWILVPRVVRTAGGVARQAFPELTGGTRPTRTDGGYGWFNVSEGAIEDYGDIGGQNSYTIAENRAELHYYWIARYFSSHLNEVLYALETGACGDFIAADGSIDVSRREPLVAAMVECGLAEKRGKRIQLAVPLLSEKEDERLGSLLDEVAESFAPPLSQLVEGVLDAHRSFTPPRLHEQIRGVIGGYLNNMAGMIVGQLEEQQVMQAPNPEEVQAKSVFATMMGKVNS